MSLVFPNVWELSMVATFLLSRLKIVQLIITIERVGTPSFYKAQLILEDGLTDIYVGWPGRVHDARVFANSSLYSRGQQNTLFTPNTSVSLSGADVPLVLLGDPAYPLLPWLMKAYVNNGRLTTQKKLFNYRLSKARVVVEHAYGRLKGRWRCLLKRLDIDVGDVSQVVTACCVLHNTCEAKGELFNDDWTEGVDVDDAVSSSSPAQPCSDSIAIRDAFTQYFSQ